MRKHEANSKGGTFYKTPDQYFQKCQGRPGRVAQLLVGSTPSQGVHGRQRLMFLSHIDVFLSKKSIYTSLGEDLKKHTKDMKNEDLETVTD